MTVHPHLVLIMTEEMKPLHLRFFFLILTFTINITRGHGEDPAIELRLPLEDTSFVQEYHDGFVVDDQISAANNVRSVYADRTNNIWIATKHGVYRKSPDSRQWQPIVFGRDQGPAYDVVEDSTGTIWLATWNGVYSCTSSRIEKENGPTAPIAKIVASSEGIYALGPYGIWLHHDDTWEQKYYPIARSIRCAASDGEGGLWVGTDVGLYHCGDREITVFQKNTELVSAYVTGIDFDNHQNMCIGGLGGVTIRDRVDKIGEKLPKDGITHAQVNVVKKSPTGEMWVGTNYGISRFTPGKEEYSVRLSKRWLLSNEVRDIAFDQSGTAWIATAAGVSAIRRRNMTLSNKADFFYNQLLRRHVRDPWIVARSPLDTPGDTSTIHPADDDNDGEYTSMYLAMESFRYAVTKDPLAKERAKKAFDFLHFLREVTGLDGFFARTIVPASWEKMHDPNRTYSSQQLAEEVIANPRQKAVENRWHLSEDGRWKWKGDTSSDELCGHLFGYYWYYNLVADEPEKARIARHLSAIIDHLMRNDYNLVDVDGNHTKWGVWSPTLLNHDPDWAPERALNSLELLSFLKFAFAITGDDKYQSAYLDLIVNHGYIDNAFRLHHTNPAWETYFDIYLALYVYPPLITYEDDPRILDEYTRHLDQWFAKYRETGSPLVNFTYNLLSGGNDQLNESIFFLKDAPLDLVDWQIDNGTREDLSLVRRPILEEMQVDHLRPPSEYRTMRWDRNPYVAVGGNPSQEREPVYWLLPYWMGRYLSLW